MRLLACLILLLFLLEYISADSLCSGDDREDEGKDETVKVTFYNMPESEWEDVEDDFSSELAKRASAFCEDKPSKCGLRSSFSRDFDDSLVKFSKDTPEEDRYSTYVYVYLAYDEAMAADVTNDTTMCVVPGSGMRAILKKYREEIGEETGFHIVGIGSAVYTIPPDSRLNSILIPVAIIALFVVVVVAIACYCWNKRQLRLARERRREDLIMSKTIVELEKLNCQKDQEMEMDGKRQDKIARHNRKKEKLEQERLSRKGKVFQTEESGAAVYELPGSATKHSYGQKQTSVSNGSHNAHNAKAPVSKTRSYRSANHFREDETDSGARPMGDTRQLDAPPTAVFHVSEAPSANANLDTIEESAERKERKKHKKHKKHKRKHEHPERDGEGEKQFNITTDTSLRMTGTDSDNEERY